MLQKVKKKSKTLLSHYSTTYFYERKSQELILFASESSFKKIFLSLAPWSPARSSKHLRLIQTRDLIREETTTFRPT